MSRGITEESRQTGGALLHGAAEEVCRPGSEDAAGRDRVAPRSPSIRPADRRESIASSGLACRAVVECPLKLAPASFEVDPRERLLRGGRIARDRLHDRAGAPRCGPRGCRRSPRPPARRSRPRKSAGLEVVGVRSRQPGTPPGVRTVRRARACPRPSRRARRPRVGCSRPRTGSLGQRLLGAGSVEEELDHLPVPLVLVVEVVEDVEEPVLQGEPGRMPRPRPTTRA